MLRNSLEKVILYFALNKAIDRCKWPNYYFGGWFSQTPKPGVWTHHCDLTLFLDVTLEFRDALRLCKFRNVA